MKRLFIRLANWGHAAESAWVRRPALVIALLGLAAWALIFYVALPLLVILLVAVAILKGVWESVSEAPSLAVNQVKHDVEEWTHNLRGALRIWKAQKS